MQKNSVWWDLEFGGHKISTKKVAGRFERENSFNISHVVTELVLALTFQVKKVTHKQNYNFVKSKHIFVRLNGKNSLG